jgi:glycosyltransferase involved in cell wall biosynthesis
MKKSWNPIDAWTQLTQSRRVRPQSTTRSTCLKSTGQVCVILPVYNEQTCIRRTFEAILHYLANHPNFTFIFVNDGSCDRTKQVLATGIHTVKTPQIQLLSYTPRAGKGYAIRRGVEYAEDSDLICYLDGDLAYSLEHLDQLVEKLRYFDIAIGCRSLVPNDKDLKWSRKLAGKVFNFLSRKILDLQYSDMQAGLKGFRTEVAKDLFSRQELTGFSFDVELIYLAKKRGYTIGEIPAKVSQKHQKKASKVNLVQDSLRMLLDLLKIRFNDQLGRYQ